MTVPSAICPNNECVVYKKTKQRYEWSLKKKTLKVNYRICPKCKHIFTV